MKTTNLKIISLSFTFLLIVSVMLTAQSLSPQCEAPILDHLVEVNKEWLKYTGFMEQPTQLVSFQQDETRIQLHLKLVYNILLTNPPAHLTEAQQQQRLALLSDLKSYYEAAIFPTNSFHKNRQPYFVDVNNNACAVGFLLLCDGQKDLVQRIQSENNYAYLGELKQQYPNIENWASNNGFTTDELAWIQPGYLPESHTWDPVGNGGGANGRINVMATNANDNLLYMAGDFSSIDGFASNSIVAFDGSSWQQLGQGVNGEIVDMAIGQDGYLYVVGDFTLNANPQFSNIARWDGGNWLGLQQGDMEGELRSICVADKIYIGGDFQKVNGMEIAYLAFRSLELSGTNWSNSVTINNQLVPHVFHVDGPVNDIIIMEDSILVAGEFIQTAPLTSHPDVHQFDTEYLATWYADNWQTAYYTGCQPVQTMAYVNEVLYLGGKEADYNAHVQSNDGSWLEIWFGVLDNNNTEGLIYGYLAFNGAVYAYGNTIPFSMALTQGFSKIDFSFVGVSGGRFDKTVRSCGILQGYVYFAGDFTTPNEGMGNDTFNGLVRSKLDGVESAISCFGDSSAYIYTHNKQLYIEYEAQPLPVKLRLYDVQGHLVLQQQLAAGAIAVQEDLTTLADGIYLYEMSNGMERVAGKLSVF